MHRKSLTLGILSIVFAGLTVAGSVNAYSLFTKGTSNIVLSFGQSAPAATYYLAGGHNSWSTSDSDSLFLDVTSQMSPEEGKVAEYKLTGLSLDKGTKVKVIKNDNSEVTWLTSEYSHCWSNSVISDGSGNYEAPMTSTNYTFYLKVFNNNVYKTYIMADKNVIYLGASTDGGNWFADGAVPKVNIKNGNSGNAKSNPGSITITGTLVGSFYKFDISDYYNNLLSGGTYYYAFQRTSGASVWNYSNWFQIGNSDTNNRFWLNGGNWDGWDAIGNGGTGWWEAM